MTEAKRAVILLISRAETPREVPLNSASFTRIKHRNLQQCFGLAALLVGAVILGAGCIFSPDKGEKKVIIPPTYPALDNPQHVLEAYMIAYQHPDSEEAKVLYDPNYLGTSESPDTTVTFSREYEIAHIGALQRATTISSIVLEFGPTITWVRLSSDDPSHPEWAQYQIPSWHLDINDGQTLYSAQSTDPITFSFAPTVSAPGDTLWKIIRWKETVTSGA
ncbi:MAG TPA: hypothetical protein VFX78_06395 [Candidatus Eisenbacteria bacterium]|nr:hypothetical protein [Candidatus Eisenbacteria bacterium]